jgi:hypothetical protein
VACTGTEGFTEWGHATQVLFSHEYHTGFF